MAKKESLKSIIKRVMIEKDELTERIVKLSSFIYFDYNFSELPEIEQHLLKRQYKLMKEYEVVLSARLMEMQNRHNKANNNDDESENPQMGFVKG